MTLRFRGTGLLAAAAIAFALVHPAAAIDELTSSDYVYGIKRLFDPTARSETTNRVSERAGRSCAVAADCASDAATATLSIG